MLHLFRRTPPSASVNRLEVSHDGEAYAIALRRLSSARRFTLRVRSASRDVTLTMPIRSSLRAAQDFADRHAAWIGARLRRLPQPIALADGATVPLRGIDHRIAHVGCERGTVWIAPSNEMSPPRICVAGRTAHLERRLLDFFKREVRRDLGEAVARHAAAAGVAVRSITIRDTASRWGSCTAAGALNFSWRLILAPSFVLDYLAAHEVAHLVHLDHSARFWALTRQLAAHTDIAEAWLRAHGAQLHRYGAAPRACEPASDTPLAAAAVRTKVR